MTIIDFRAGLRAFLLPDSNISAAVGAARIYHMRMPQGIRDASIVYQRISNVGDHHMGGASGISRPRVQIDCYARDIDTASALADLVKGRLDGYSGLMDTVVVQGCFFETEDDDYEESAELMRVRHDYQLIYESL